MVHSNVRFFFYANSLTALCDSFCTTCCIFSAQIALLLSQVHSHTSLLFEYIIFHKNLPTEVRFESFPTPGLTLENKDLHTV